MPEDYAVCVSFSVKPEHAERFVARVRQQARDSLTEPGCRVFEVWTDTSRPDEVFLYEIYAGQAAFDAHLRTDHLHAFERDVADWVDAKTVVTWDRGDAPARTEQSGRLKA